MTDAADHRRLEPHRTRPRPLAAAGPQVRRRRRRPRARRCTSLGAAVGALALVWLVYERLLPMTGAIGFWLCWYVVVPRPCSPAVSATTLDRVAVIDRLVGALVHHGRS